MSNPSSVFRFEGRDVEDAGLADRHRENRDMPVKSPPHPGPSVRHDCLEPLGLSVAEAARKPGVGRVVSRFGSNRLGFVACASIEQRIRSPVIHPMSRSVSDTPAAIAGAPCSVSWMRTKSSCVKSRARACADGSRSSWRNRRSASCGQPREPTHPPWPRFDGLGLRLGFFKLETLPAIFTLTGRPLVDTIGVCRRRIAHRRLTARQSPTLELRERRHDQPSGRP